MQKQNIIHFALTLEEFVWTYDNEKFGGKYEILKLLLVFLCFVFFRSKSYLLSLLSVFFFGSSLGFINPKKKKVSMNFSHLYYGYNIHTYIHTHTYIYIYAFICMYVHLWRVLFFAPYPISPLLPKQQKLNTKVKTSNRVAFILCIVGDRWFPIMYVVALCVVVL
jgi:hypothetical protein